MREAVKRPAREAYQLSPSFAKVNDVWLYLHSAHSFIIKCFIFTFTVALIIEVSSGIVSQRCQDSVYSVYNDKLQNCSCNLFE